MSTKHTPGQWVARPSVQNKSERHYWIERTDGTAVASINFGDTPGDEADANARLIAAAPELFEACREMYVFCGTDAVRRSMGPQFDRVFGLARAAIARAKGGEA